MQYSVKKKIKETVVLLFVYLLTVQFELKIHYTAKSIHSPTQFIEFRCFYHFHGHRSITFVKRFTKERVTLTSLSEFQHGIMIGCHLCNKSSGEISLQLKIPHSLVSGISTKWKWMGTTATKPQSGNPHKITEVNDCWGAYCTEVTDFLQSQ